MNKFTDRLVPAAVALDAKNNRYATWKRALSRLSPEAWPVVSPSYQIEQGAKVFTIGSCFARNIEENLSKLGFDVPTTNFKLPNPEVTGRPANILNKYTPPAIFQEFEWACTVHQSGGIVTKDNVSAFGFICDDGRIIDMHLAGLEPVTEERFVERRQDVYETFKEAFTSDVIIITFGYVESWYDLQESLFIQWAPNAPAMRARAERFAFVSLDYDMSRDYAIRTIDLLRKYNPKCKLLITTSPVPLSRTFRDIDVILANSESKAILRALCGELSSSYERVDYFPSFENVTLTNKRELFEGDQVHVKSDFVASIVVNLTDSYFANAAPVAKAYQRAFELAKKNQITEAIDVLTRAIEVPTIYPQETIYLAELLVQDKRFKEADALIDAVLHLCSTDPYVHHLLSRVKFRVASMHLAEIHARKAVHLDQNNAGYRMHLAQICSNLGYYPDAIENGLRATSLNRNNANYAAQLASIYRSSGQYDAAMSEIARALSIEPSNVRYEIAMAEIALEANELAKAEQHLARAKLRILDSQLATRVETLERKLASYHTQSER